jgi:hypothetical protein
VHGPLRTKADDPLLRVTASRSARFAARSPGSAHSRRPPRPELRCRCGGAALAALLGEIVLERHPRSPDHVESELAVISTSVASDDIVPLLSKRIRRPLGDHRGEPGSPSVVWTTSWTDFRQAPADSRSAIDETADWAYPVPLR